MGSRARLAVGGAACVLVAVVLGVLVVSNALDSPNALDRWWSAVASDMRSPLTTSIALGFNELGRGFVARWVVPAVVLVILLLARRPFTAGFSVVVAIATWAVVQILKSVLARERPEDILVESDFGSFPSGHAASAAVVGTVFVLAFRSVAVRVVAVVYVVGMMWSRTLLGAHWATDVVGGALVGVGVVLLLAAVFSPLLRRDHSRRGTRRRARA